MSLQYFLNNLCKEILVECKYEDIECYQNFILYYLKLLSLDPLWNLFPKMKDINRMDALALIKFVVAKMSHQICPCIVTLKIQMYFNCNFEGKKVIVDVERTNFENRLRPLEDEVVEITFETTNEHNHLRRLIVYYITLLRGLGNPSKQLVYREGKQAFFSVYDKSDLKCFTEKERSMRLLQLAEMASICAGIRIFNWTCEIGGVGIENVPLLANEAISGAKTDMEAVLGTTMTKINTLTTIVDNCFVTASSNKPGADEDNVVEEYRLECELPVGMKYEDMEYIKDLLITLRQMEVMLRQLLAEAQHSTLFAAQLDATFQETLDEIHNLAYLKVGISTDKVFPKFILLDNIWKEYQNEIIYTTKLSQILVDLCLFVQDLHINEEHVEMVIQNGPIVTDADRLNMEDEIITIDQASHMEIIELQDESQLNDIRPEFLGFCPWKLVETQGGLIPGNPNIGIVVFNDKHYIFSSLLAARAFQISPHLIINEVLELTRKKSELIPLLQLEEQLMEVQLIKELVIEQKHTEVKSLTNDMRIQTDLHPVPSWIDDKYMWNMWDYKRQAIRLADISKRRTKSTQTVSSKNKNAVITQTHVQRMVSCQTRRENYTNVATPQAYFFGLRGRTDNKQFILDITRPVKDK